MKTDNQCFNQQFENSHSNRKPFTLSRRYLIALGVTAIAMTALTAFNLRPAQAQVFDYFWPKDTLQNVVEDIAKRYPGVQHMTPDQLAKDLSEPDKTILIDVRDPEEYAVSHISGAIRTDPNATTDELTANISTELKGKSVVFYCSVGERSSRLAKRAKTQLISSGAKAVYNLDGGIFAWHNEKKKLINAKGATPYVHPFDSHWGTYVTRKNLTRLKPPDHQTIPGE